MEYLFLILVCYAVKCEDVGNNYFVVKKPEDIQPQDAKDFKKPFQVYWNVPTMQCTSKRIPFQNLYEKFGIIQNDNDRFIGNKIVVIYNEIDFPAIIKNKSGKNVLRNGGVPQEGNLENHLIAFENNLNDKIPDPYFDGIAIIDFESRRPVFRQNFGSLLPHKTLSIEIEKRLHNWWPKMWIGREASLRFEAAARRFMSTTLSMAKEIRPNALWGYYGFPYCFNMRGRDVTEKCASNIDKENDSIYWLWAESTALFPSIYSSVSLSSSQLSSLIKGRLKEASRVRGGDTPIFPYVWYRYRDSGFITEKDLDVAFATLYQSNASGLIIWGSSNDVNTVKKCNKLLKYVETVLGPKIAKYAKPIRKFHNDHLKNKEIYTKETPKVIDGIFYSQSTQSLNTDQLFSTETLNDYNKFTKTNKNSQTLNNDEMSSTESIIKYNEYTNTDDSKILHNFDLTSSLLEFSTIHSEYAYQSKQSLNNDGVSSTETAIAFNKHTNNVKNSQSLNNDDNFLSQISKAYSKYTNTVQTTQTLNNNEISLAENSNSYNAGNKSSQTSNIDISDTKTPYVDNDSSEAKKNMEPLISADLISLSKPSTIDSTIDDIYRDRLSQTSNVSYRKTTIDYNDYSETKKKLPTLNNYDVMSSSESSTTSEENTTSFNTNEISLSKITYFDNSYRDESSQTLNTQMSSEETTIAYKESSENKENVQILNNDDVVSLSDFSYYENRDYSTTILNNDEMSLSKITTLHNNYREESSQTLNMSSEETTIAYNKYFETENNLPTLDNRNALSTTISGKNEDHNTFFFNNDEITSTDTSCTKYINTDKEIPSKGTSIIYDHFSEDQNTKSLHNIEHLKETSPPSVEISYTDKSTAILIDGEIITEDYNLESTGDDFFITNGLPNSSEDRLDFLIRADNFANIEIPKQSEHENLKTHIDNKIGIERNEELPTKDESFLTIKPSNSDSDRPDYLIIADNSINIETYNHSENTNITNHDNNYLIIVPDFNNEKSKIDNILDNNLDLETTTQTKSDFEKDTKFEEFGEPAEHLDPVVAYINKLKDNQELIMSTGVEPLNNIELLNSDEDASDYLIKLVTNKDTDSQYEYTESTIADDDYIIIVKNLVIDDSE